jgi:DNA excision repair protein ERCC-2
MSATLEPIDVYRDVTGMDILANASEHSDVDTSSRRVEDCTFGLDYPEENRLTVGANAERFKYDNKKKAFNGNTPNKDNEVRRQYYSNIRSVVDATPGNVLVCMPNYKEARWAGKLLRKDYDVNAGEVFIDKSSSNWETEQTKQEFFNSDNAVLTTAAHGTLVEGVDYDGDRLHGVVVCGVPLENTKSDSKTAVQTAYEDTFGDKGYDYAFTVPAVRKSRQAIGRVIRSDTDVGVRAFIDARYVEPSLWDEVNQYLADYEKDELVSVSPEGLETMVESFWEGKSV